MKKLLATIFTVLLLFGIALGFSSCGSIVSEQEGFFTASALKDAGLAGLSKPNFTYKTSAGSSLSGDMKEAEFTRYAQEVCTYLTSKYEYVGIAGEQYTGFYAGACKYKFVECGKELSSYVKESGSWGIKYEFVFFRGTPKQDEQTTDALLLEWRRASVTNSGSNISWNFQMTLNKFDTLEDMYHYTNEQQFETVYSKSKGSWFEKEYPCIIVVRSQTALDEYPNEPWYNPSYDFSKGFLVALQLSADNSEGYKVTSVWKQDGKFVFTIARCTADEEMSMGEWDIALRFDKHTKINTPEDIVLKFI